MVVIPGSSVGFDEAAISAMGIAFTMPGSL